MRVEHHWQAMYVSPSTRWAGARLGHFRHRPGPLGHSRQSARPAVYRLLGGPLDPRGVRGYYHVRAQTKDELAQVRASAKKLGITAFKSGIPGPYEWIETNRSIRRAVEAITRLREGLGDDIDIGVDFHAKTSPSVATIICKEVEPLHLMFIEEPCPPENVKAMARIARRTTTPIATGERLVASYSCRELIELGVADILQVDVNHVGASRHFGRWGQWPRRQAFGWRHMLVRVRSEESPRCT